MNDWLHLLDGGLKQQNYREIDMSTLNEAGSIELDGGVPDDIDKALAGLRESTDWGAIGQQLALMKRLPNFRAVYIRADEHAIKLAVVFETPHDADFESGFDFSWQCDLSLEPHLKGFNLSPEFLSLVNTTITKYGGNNSAIIQAAVNWLVIALKISDGSGPNGAFIGACQAGVDQALKKRLDQRWQGSDFQKFKESEFSLHPPSMQGIAWDMTTDELVGDAGLAVNAVALHAALQDQQ